VFNILKFAHDLEISKPSLSVGDMESISGQNGVEKEFKKASEAILNDWTVGKDGTLDAGDFVALVRSEQQQKKSNAKLRMVLLALALVILLLVGAIFGMSLWASEVSKETHTSSDGVMRSTSGKTVLVGQAKEKLKLFDLVQASTNVLLSVDRLQLETTSGYDFIVSVQSIARNKDSLTIFGSGGMRLEVTGQIATLVLPGGESHVVKTHDANGRRLCGESRYAPSCPEPDVWVNPVPDMNWSQVYENELKYGSRFDPGPDGH